MFGFLLLIVFDTWAQISFKLAGADAAPPEARLAWVLRLLSSPWTYAALAGYIGAFFTWMNLLKHAPIGPAFAASHLEVVSVMLFSALLFNEHISIGQSLGAFMIVAGIVCLALGERRAAPSLA
jgi:drug/metabolite transporter (DMT)-like permease